MFERGLKAPINRRILRSACRISFTGLFLFLSLNFLRLPATNSFFSDTATTEGNTITAGYWEPEAEPGDVIINEIMWMGSDGDSADEWIELRNMTDDEIDLSNWDIVHGGVGGGGHIEIPHGYSIKANDYFLITKKKWDETAIKLESDLDKDEGYTHVSGMSLKNSGEDLILRDKDKNVIDTAWKNERWPAGENEDDKKSMERNDTPGDGTESGSWHTCTDERCNDGEYWDDDDGNNYGTPGAENHSENDPSSEDDEDSENKEGKKDKKSDKKESDDEDELVENMIGAQSAADLAIPEPPAGDDDGDGDDIPEEDPLAGEVSLDGGPARNASPSNAGGEGTSEGTQEGTSEGTGTGEDGAMGSGTGAGDQTGDTGSQDNILEELGNLSADDPEEEIKEPETETESLLTPEEPKDEPAPATEPADDPLVDGPAPQ